MIAEYCTEIHDKRREREKESSNPGIVMRFGRKEEDKVKKSDQIANSMRAIKAHPSAVKDYKTKNNIPERYSVPDS